MALRKDSAPASCSICIVALYTGTFSCQLEYLSLPSRLRAFGHSKNVLESTPGTCPVPEQMRKHKHVVIYTNLYNQDAKDM